MTGRRVRPRRVNGWAEHSQAHPLPKVPTPFLVPERHQAKKKELAIVDYLGIHSFLTFADRTKAWSTKITPKIVAMNTHATTRYFRSLAYLAIMLLWGISIVNGTVWALVQVMWYGRLPDGSVFKNNYTGVFLLDFPIGLLVAFFFYGTNGQYPGYQAFLVDAYSTLQPGFVWLYIEASRPSAPKWVARPVVFGILWQCFGAAISLPLWYALHLSWWGGQRKKDTDTAAPDLHRMHALPLAFLGGAILPAVLGMAPGTWLGPNDRDPVVHQAILLAWQPDPLWVSGLLTGGAALSARLWPASERRAGSAHAWARAALLLAALSSAAGHLYATAQFLGTNGLSWSHAYVPHPLGGGPAGVEDILARGPWLFLQFDLIIISISSLSWAYLLARGMVSDGVLLMTIITGTLTVGPGAVVSLLLWAREGWLMQEKIVE